MLINTAVQKKKKRENGQRAKDVRGYSDERRERKEVKQLPAVDWFRSAKPWPATARSSSLDDVIEGFEATLVLPIGQNDAGIEVALEELEDLEPDELFEELDVFADLAGIRSGHNSPATPQPPTRSKPPKHGPKRSGATSIPADKQKTLCLP